MKKAQWITIAAAGLLVIGLYTLARTKPYKSTTTSELPDGHSADDGHDHGNDTHQHREITIDTILKIGKSAISPEQLESISKLEASALQADDSKKPILYHQLSHFWKDTARIFELYGWYEAELARLENSEKSLTFAAHLFLDNLQTEPDVQLARWKALQAKDLFERSLKLNPNNDSSKVGLGACYLFGNISPMPMEGINKIREVVERDSTHVFGQLMLARGSLRSNQVDKAIPRLETILRLEPENIEAMLILADCYERLSNKASAISWYRKAQEKIPVPQIKEEIEKRIKELSK